MHNPLTASKMTIQVCNTGQTKDMAEKPRIYKTERRKSSHRYRMNAHTNRRTEKSEEGSVIE
jgi:hypothetical protein